MRYVAESQQGVQYARNAAAKTAQTAMLACIDDDAIVDPHWLEEVSRFMLATKLAARALRLS